MKIKEETRNDIRSSWPFLVILALMILVAFSLQIYFYNYIGVRKDILPILYFLSVIPFFLLFYYFKSKNGIKFIDVGFTFNKLKKNIALGITVGVLAGLIGWILVWLLNLEIKNVPTGQERTYFILLFIPMCIFAPIWEEIATRGLFFVFMKKILKTKLNDRRYVKDVIIIICVSLFFLFAHLDREAGQLIIIFVTSLMFTIAYFKTRSIIVPILAHSIYNLFVIWLLFI